MQDTGAAATGLRLGRNPLAQEKDQPCQLQPQQGTWQCLVACRDQTQLWGEESIWAGDTICSPMERRAVLCSRAPMPKMAQGRAAFAAWGAPAPKE